MNNEVVKPTEQNPQGYGPKKPEILDLARQTEGMANQTTQPHIAPANTFETRRVILRHFVPEDWQDLLEIARSKEASPYAYTDHPWPTNEEWAKESAAYMATDNDMWAIVRNEDNKVICFVNCNGINDAKIMDVGHVMNLAFAEHGYEEEGLSILFDHIFDTMGVVGISASWALEDHIKINPLMNMGMDIVHRDIQNAFDGSGKTFTHCSLQITKEKWLQQKNRRNQQ